MRSRRNGNELFSLSRVLIWSRLETAVFSVCFGLKRTFVVATIWCTFHLYSKMPRKQAAFSFFSGGDDGREIGVFRHSCFSYVYQSILSMPRLNRLKRITRNALRNCSTLHWMESEIYPNTLNSTKMPLPLYLSKFFLCSNDKTQPTTAEVN